MKISITGQNGFIGSHLYNYFIYKRNDIELIEFEKSFFKNENSLDKIISTLDVIVHFAALNRHKNEGFLYDYNINLTNSLIESIKRTNYKGKLIFASSSQEELSNAYGRSKKDSRKLFQEAAKLYKFEFSGLVIPNVYGPFCKPDYNSFVATFCNNIISEKKIQIAEKKIKLIYIDSLIDKINDQLNVKGNSKIVIKEDTIASVNEIYNILDEFKSQYYNQGIIPNIDSKFRLNLFNTFSSYIPFNNYFPRKYDLNTDERGLFSEIIRSNNKGQFSYSITKKGIERGNHFHTRKVERFSVISGSAVIQIRKIGSNKIYTYNLNGKEPSYVAMPIWYTHNIKNTGNTPLITLFWINEFYDEADADTFFEKV